MDTRGPYKKIFRLTPKVIRRRFYAAFVLIGTVGALEIFSLSALLAFFTLGLNSGEKVQWEWLSAWLGERSLSPSSVLLGVALGLFVVKAYVILLVGKHSYRTATKIKRYFQERLFERFLHSPFRELTNKRSSDWVRSITIDCNALEGRFFMPILILLGEIIPAIGVCGLLLVVNATAFIVAILVFAVVGIWIFLTTHNRLVRLGQAQQTADGHIVQSAQQAFHGLRELTIYGLHGWAQQRFESFTAASSWAINEALFISLLPRFVFEVAIYISLGLVFTIYALQGTPVTQVIGEFAVFGAAAMRLLPSVSKVVSHLQSLKHARPAVLAVTQTLATPLEELHPSTQKGSEPINFETLSLRSVCFFYNESPVLESLTLDVVTGDSIGIVGASGSGKSTLVNIILGLLSPSQGRVLLNAAPLASSKETWWSCIGYVPQEPFLMDASAIANVMLGSTSHSDEDIARARDLIDRLNLPEAMKNSSESIGEDGARLSGGQRQRLAIARALYRQPQVLILDEATSAMDAFTQAKVMDIVSECMHGRTIMMVTHRVENLGYCNKILTLPDGTLEHTGKGKNHA